MSRRERARKSEESEEDFASRHEGDGAVYCSVAGMALLHFMNIDGT
jgi:hypothetical protein